MIDDAQLLRRYAEEQSQTAFAELVQRHLAWIYRTALRRTGGRADLAQDVAQYVFIALAKQAKPLAEREQLAGWFYTTIRNAAHQLMRAEARRRIHESAAAMSLYDEASADTWVDLRPTLDHALDRLAAPDREALILRFFEGKSYSAIGQQLRLGEDGARKRVERALDRLGAQFSHRGVASSVAAIAGLLTAEGATAVPAGLQASVLQSALSGVSSASTASGVALLMNATKATWAGLALLGVLGIATLSTVGVAVGELRALRRDQAAAQSAAQRLQSAQSELSAVERAAAAVDLGHAAGMADNSDAARRTAEATRASQAAAQNAAAAREKKGKADAQDFFRQYAQGKTALLQFFREEAAAGNALYFRKAGLTPAQIQALVTQTANYWLDSTVLTPESGYFTGPPLPDDQVRAIAGEAGLQAYKDSVNSGPALGWVGLLARSSAEGGVPLSLDQAEAMTQAVASHSPEYVSGRMVDPANVDWDSALAQVQKLMTPAQWAQVQPTIQMEAVQRQQAQAVRAEGATW